jgi:hypothetical protein
MLWSFGIFGANFGVFFPRFGLLRQEKSGNPGENSNPVQSCFATLLELAVMPR